MSLARYHPPSESASYRSVEMAAVELDLTSQRDRDYAAANVSATRTNAEQSWMNYRRIGELRYGVWRLARVAGYASLFGAKLDARGNVVEVAKSGSPAIAAQRLYSRFGGVRGLIERFYILSQIPGEAWLANTAEGIDGSGAVDGLWFLSSSEIDRNSIAPGTPVTNPVSWQTMKRRPTDTAVAARTILPQNFLGRVWTPDPEYVDDASSPMESINYLCDLLWDLTESIKSRLQSRFAMAGFLLIPNEMSDAAISGTPPAVQYSNDKVLNYIIHVLTQNMKYHGTALGSMPIAIKGPADALEKFRHVVADVSISETDLTLRGEILDRIFDAFDAPKASVQGGQGESHWGGWLRTDEERRIAVQPTVEAMCHALTRLAYWPTLRELQPRWSEQAIREWRVWPDLSAASVKTNRADDARLAWDRGWVNDDFGRDTVGASDIDAMTPEERVRWTGIKMRDPYLALYGLDDDGITIEWDKVGLRGGARGPTPDSESGPAEVGPGVGQPGSPDDRDSDEPDSDTPA